MSLQRSGSSYLVLLAAMCLPGCSGDESAVEDMALNAPQQSSGQREVDRSVAISDSSEPLIIDVRSAEEWNSGHLDQAIHIPHTEISDRIGRFTTDKDRQIVLYCAVGGRAGKAKTKLEALGFTNVENAGGFDDVKQRFK